MLYVSTRGHADRKRFCEILLEGLAPDGGLYLPEQYPQVDAATCRSGAACLTLNWRSRSSRSTSTTFPPPTSKPSATRPTPKRCSAPRPSFR
jgi:threonine synthase